LFIADFTIVIRIDTSAYLMRGIAKENAGLSDCSHYKKAFDLGIDNGGEWYYKLCS